MIVVHAALRIDPDRREDALAVAEDLVERTREEEGVVDEAFDPNADAEVEGEREAE